MLSIDGSAWKPIGHVALTGQWAHREAIVRLRLGRTACGCERELTMVIVPFHKAGYQAEDSCRSVHFDWFPG